MLNGFLYHCIKRFFIFKTIFFSPTIKKNSFYIFIFPVLSILNPLFLTITEGSNPAPPPPPPPNNSNPPELLQTPIINSNQRFQPHLNSKPPLIFRTQEYKYCFHATNKLANEILQKLIYD